MSGCYLIAIHTISPSPPAPANRFLFALPVDRTIQPAAGGSGLPYTFLFPGDCVLTRVHLHGRSRTLRSYNTLGAGGVTPHSIDLYVNGEFAETLLTLSAGATDVDIYSEPDIAIKAGSEVQFIVPVEGNASGAIMNFLLAFAVE